jgi:hypothetical protein
MESGQSSFDNVFVVPNSYASKYQKILHPNYWISLVGSQHNSSLKCNQMLSPYSLSILEENPA